MYFTKTSEQTGVYCNSIKNIVNSHHCKKSSMFKHFFDFINNIVICMFLQHNLLLKIKSSLEKKVEERKGINDSVSETCEYAKYFLYTIFNANSLILKK